MLRDLLKSGSLRAATVLGVGGVCFTLGNLILARALSSQEYGVVSLFIGIVAVAGLTAPLGFDLVAARRGLRLNAPWRRAALAASGLTAVGTVLFGSIAYHLSPVLLACLFITSICAGVMQASAGHFQGQRLFGRAAWILQLSNWTLIPVALFTVLLGVTTAAGTCILMAAAGVLTAVASWAFMLGSQGEPQPRPLTLLGEALSLVMITTSTSIFLQLERLLLAPIVGVDELAMFGVLAALVGSPFRMLQAAVQFTLIPGLRAVDVSERVRLLRREVLMVTTAIVGGSVAIWFVAPPLAHWFLAGRYDLTAALMMAALVSGVLKVFCAFAVSPVMALARERDLRLLSAISWASIGVSIIAAVAAAPWGLVGVLYGISFGWLVRGLASLRMALPHLRQSASASTQAGRHLPSPSG